MPTESGQPEDLPLHERRADPDAAALAEPTTGAVDRYHLCFALAKALEDQGEFAESLHCYELGNSLKRVETRYRAEIIENKYASADRGLQRRVFAGRRGWGAPSPDPIFIVGLPRSGSTLLEQILASHSKVEGTQELPERAAARQHSSRP